MKISAFLILLLPCIPLYSQFNMLDPAGGGGGNGTQSCLYVYGQDDPGANEIHHFEVFFIDNGVDPNDCISSDWQVTYYFHNGQTQTNISYNVNLPGCVNPPTDPNCYEEIDFNYWNCCPGDFISSGGSGGGGGLGTTCIFSPACSDCDSLQEWISCGLTCSSC